MPARGIRNNNPGNIVKSGIAWTGKKEDLAESRFEVFDTPEHGLLALCQNLINYQEKHGCNTIRKVIDRWAPPSENDTGAYIASVVASVGVGADAAMDIHDPRLLAAIAVAIIKVENGEDPYPAAMVESAATQALGIAASPPQAPAAPSSGGSMGALAALQLFGPILANLIPQISSLVKPDSKSATKDANVAATLINTITQAAAAPNLQGAVEAMQADKTVQDKVQAAIVTHPDILPLLTVTEIGGGITAAAERGVQAQMADKPFWYNPVVWITAALIPMMYMITFQTLFTLAGPYMVSNGIAGSALQPNPWYAVIGFDSNTRTGLINLIVGFVFGGICGIWFGTTVAKTRSELTNSQAVADVKSP